jgi:hypothetical protein
MTGPVGIIFWIAALITALSMALGLISFLSRLDTVGILF